MKLYIPRHNSKHRAYSPDLHLHFYIIPHSEWVIILNHYFAWSTYDNVNLLLLSHNTKSTFEIKWRELLSSHVSCNYFLNGQQEVVMIKYMVWRFAQPFWPSCPTNVTNGTILSRLTYVLCTKNHVGFQTPVYVQGLVVQVDQLLKRISEAVVCPTEWAAFVLQVPLLSFWNCIPLFHHYLLSCQQT